MSVFVLIPTVVAVITGVTAIVNTWKVLRPAPRRRINYRVHLDAKVGARPDVTGLAELVVRREIKGKLWDVPDASVVLVRISNDGGLDIGAKDYVQHVKLRFGGRRVMGVEVKDVTASQREMLLGSPETDAASKSETSPDTEATSDAEASKKEKELLTFTEGRTALQLPKMQLNKKDRFRMLVLLSGDGKGVEASGVLDGAVKGGGVVEETAGLAPSKETKLALGFGATATASLIALVLVLLFVQPMGIPAGAVRCVPDKLTVSGSTAFAPAADDIAQKYQDACEGAEIQVNGGGHATGSHGGVLELATAGKNDPQVREHQIAMSDGTADGYPALTQEPIAVIIFSMVVNKQTGVHSLTTDDLRRIYRGEVTNWAQLGGKNLPISIVSRGTDSGTRSTFDQKLLEAAEPAASSYNCTTRDPNLPASPVVRCETSTTEALLDQVNAIPGAIGYAEMSLTSTAQPTKYQEVDQIQLNGRDAAPESVKNGQYPFWTVEYFYTYGPPVPGSLLSAFHDYFGSDTAKSRMQYYGHLPCSDGQLQELCH